MYLKKVQSKPKQNQFKYSNEELFNKACIFLNIFLIIKPKN